MGSCQSTPIGDSSFSLVHGSRDQLHLFPSWCHINPSLDDRHVLLVKNSWKRLTEGGSNAFMNAKANDSSLTPMRFFYDEFYSSIFEWIPEVRPMFSHGIHVQGKMLANIMSTIVNSDARTTEEESKLKKNLRWLARTHNLRGIQQHWYDIFGLSMLHTIRKCTDPDFFTEDVRQAWIALFSRMMVIMIPEVAANTMPGAEDETLQAVFRKRAEVSSSDLSHADSKKVYASKAQSSTRA